MFKAYTKKEILEITRNYKLYIILLVFVFFGFSNPIMAKLTPELLKSTGLEIVIPEPTQIDSWIQFFKNTSTLLALYIILFSSSLPNEINNNSLINLITKGLPRMTIIVSKYIVISSLWLISYYICFGITYVYTPLLLDGNVTNTFVASIFPAIFGLFLLSTSLFGAVITKQTTGAILIPLVTYIGLSLLSLIESVSSYLPIVLQSDSLNLITGETQIDNFMTPSLITLGCILIIIIASISIFNKQQL